MVWRSARNWSDGTRHHFVIVRSSLITWIYQLEWHVHGTRDKTAIERTALKSVHGRFNMVCASEKALSLRGISRLGNLLMLARAVNPCLLLRNFHRIRSFRAERTYHEDPRWSGWEVVVGLEVHAQLKTRKKLFSGQRTISKRRMSSYVWSQRILNIWTWSRCKYTCLSIRCCFPWNIACKIILARSRLNIYWP